MCISDIRENRARAEPVGAAGAGFGAVHSHGLAVECFDQEACGASVGSRGNCAACKRRRGVHGRGDIAHNVDVSHGGCLHLEVLRGARGEPRCDKIERIRREQGSNCNRACRRGPGHDRVQLCRVGRLVECIERKHHGVRADIAHARRRWSSDTGAHGSRWGCCANNAAAENAARACVGVCNMQRLKVGRAAENPSGTHWACARCTQERAQRRACLSIAEPRDGQAAVAAAKDVVEIRERCCRAACARARRALARKEESALAVGVCGAPDIPRARKHLCGRWADLPANCTCVCCGAADAAAERAVVAGAIAAGGRGVDAGHGECCCAGRDIWEYGGIHKTFTLSVSAADRVWHGGRIDPRCARSGGELGLAVGEQCCGKGGVDLRC
eukprot:comp22273_c0_seq1/m.53096 comp22273_c0_seq1/g.53096  ORF comp22273_c0_seq1/g.53096 comp22273_c0_seq1/m.53096 type:complete len:386 (-) comp22273_c0_seq1:671-1828(-)